MSQRGKLTGSERVLDSVSESRGALPAAEDETIPRDGESAADWAARMALPQFYAQEAYDDFEYEEAGRWVTESHPYQAIRKREFKDSNNHSHEIGRAHSEHWAKVIVGALNEFPDKRIAEPVRVASGTDASSPEGET